MQICYPEESLTAAAKQQSEKTKKWDYTASENRPQEHDRSYEDMEEAEKCSWYRFKHYRSNSALQ
jgi:hypothetical protein